MAKGDKEDVAKAKAKAAKIAKALKAARALDRYYYTDAPLKNKANRKVTKAIKLDVKQSVKSAVKNNEITLNKKSPISAKQPSVASKANAKNKMKAQGSKINSSATSGYNRQGKK
jgi:hypothetical protein